MKNAPFHIPADSSTLWVRPKMKYRQRIANPTLANCPVMLTSKELVPLNVIRGGSNNEGGVKEQDASIGN